MTDLLKDMKARVTKEAADQMAYRCRQCVETAQKVDERMPRVLAELERIENCGLLTEELTKQIGSGEFGWSRISLKIEAQDLPKWRVLGKLMANGKDFDRHDVRTGKDYIRVTIHVDGLNEFDLEYVRELPAGSRCQVINQVSSYKTLMCNR